MEADPSFLTKEMLDEFYAEAEEHLVSIRQALAGIEPSVDTSVPPSEIVNKLFRSVHTLKGTFGIVNLREAERLAHAAEDYLRLVSNQQRLISRAGFNALSDATQALEAAVAAHRAGEAPADAGRGIAALAAITADTEARGRHVAEAEAPAPKEAPAVRSGSVGKRVEEALAAHKTVWRATFTPTPMLDKRGVNVNVIRARLAAEGEILDAAPIIRGGNIAFGFVVAVANATDWPAWVEDGLVAVPYEPEAEKPEARAVQEPAPAAHTPFLAPSHVVRVDLSKLDNLMRIAGDMVVRRARLGETIDAIRRKHPGIDVRAIEESSAALGRDIRDIRDAIMRVRLVPAAEIFSRMPFVVRDLARATGKSINVTVSGEDTQLDKYIAERLKDPLLHLVRNAVGHAIETTEERRAAGKPLDASISLAAATSGDVVIIRIRDDGRGIDARAVARRAESLGLPVPQQLDASAILDLISSPGFSTREEADRVSGRGVGMSVVANTVRELGGTMLLETTPGEGSTFTLRLPLTLAILDALIVTAGGQTFAVPQSSIEQIIQVERKDVSRVGAARIIQHRGTALPLLSLPERLHLPVPDQTRNPALVVTTERGPVGIQVDRVFNQREIVVRPLGDELIQVSGFAGATDLGDGIPVLIIDALAICRRTTTISGKMDQP